MGPMGPPGHQVSITPPEPVRILFITDFYHPYSGGVENHVRAVAAELAARQHQVGVATLGPPPGHEPRTMDGSVQVFAVHHSAERIGARFAHTDRPWAPPMPDPVAAKELRSVISAFKPDLIHGHDWLARSALPKAVSGDIPIVNSLHYYTRTCAKKTLWRDDEVCPGPRLRDCLTCAGEHYGRVRGTAVTLGLRLGSALEDRRTHRWISVSNATATGNGLPASAAGPATANSERSAVVANPVPTPVALTAAERAEVDLRDVPDGPFILFVGDIRPEKGLTVLTEAVQRLRQDFGDQTPLVVVGERMHDSIALPANTIELGPVPNTVVQELWAQATVGVVPSLWPEPFGLVAIEAMTAGCPLVASDIGGLQDILANGGGRLFPPGDSAALAEILSDLLGDPEARAELAAVGIEQAARYGIGPIVDEIEEQYRLAINSAKAIASS